MREIPSCRVSAVFTGFLLGGGSLPPDFANRCVKSLAVVLTRCLQVLCSVAAHFRQFCQLMCEIPSPCFNTIFSIFLLGRGSLPPDFANRCVKLLAILLMCRCLLLSIVFLGSLFLFPLDIVRNRAHFSGEAVWSCTKAYESRSCVRHIIIPVTTHCHTLVLLLLHSHT